MIFAIPLVVQGVQGEAIFLSGASWLSKSSTPWIFRSALAFFEIYNHQLVLISQFRKVPDLFQTSVPFMEEGLDTPERAALRDADAARSYGGGSSAAEIETNA